MPTRIAGCVVKPDGTIKVVRLVAGQEAPVEGTIDIRRFKDPMIAQTVKLGGLATIYQGQEDPPLKTIVHRKGECFGYRTPLHTADVTITFSEVGNEHKTDHAESPRLPVAPIPQVRMW